MTSQELEKWVDSIIGFTCDGVPDKTRLRRRDEGFYIEYYPPRLNLETLLATFADPEDHWLTEEDIGTIEPDGQGGLRSQIVVPSYAEPDAAAAL